MWTGQELIIWDISSQRFAAYTPDLDIWRALPSIDLTGDTGVLRWTGDVLYAFADRSSAYPLEPYLKVARLNQEGGWDTVAPGIFSTDDLIVGPDAALTVWTGDHFLAWTSSGTDGKTLKLAPSDTSWTETDPIPIHPCEGQGEPTQPGPLVTAFDSCDSSVLVLDPDTGSWSTSRVTGYPTARHTIWAGAELINWGGGCCPTIDSWRYTPGSYHRVPQRTSHRGELGTVLELAVDEDEIEECAGRERDGNGDRCRELTPSAFGLQVEMCPAAVPGSPEGRASPQGGPPFTVLEAVLHAFVTLCIRFRVQVSKDPTISPLSWISRLSPAQLPSGTAMVNGSITSAHTCSEATWEIISISMTSPSSSTVQKIS